jgi:uncharacterized membrane protein YedE/YeeE
VNQTDLIASGAGLLLGVAVGAIAQVTTFCSVGAVADIVLAGDWRRMRSWLMALATALLGTQGLSAAGLADIGDNPYGLTPLAWPTVLAGSLAFGFGMAQAGGCVQRALVRAGSGSIKSLVTLILIAVTAAATLLLHRLPEPSSVTLPVPFAFAITVPLALGLIAFCLKDSWFRASPGHLWGGIGIGAAVAVAWVFADSRHGFNLLLDLGHATAHVTEPEAPLSLFGIAALAGIALGAAVAAAARGDLYLDRFVDGADVKRHVVGGVLMGIGGALALGCSFGQGLTGFSTLSASAVVAIIGMTAGCVWGIRALEAGSALGGLRLVFGAR